MYLPDRFCSVENLSCFIFYYHRVNVRNPWDSFTYERALQVLCSDASPVSSWKTVCTHLGIYCYTMWKSSICQERDSTAPETGVQARPSWGFPLVEARSGAREQKPSGTPYVGLLHFRGFKESIHHQQTKSWALVFPWSRGGSPWIPLGCFIFRGLR